MGIKMWLMLAINLLIIAVILLLHWLNIITLTDVFTSEGYLLKLAITALDDPTISGGLTLTITLIFLLSNSLTTSLLVVVFTIFCLHWLNILRFPGFFPSALDDPNLSGAVTATIAVFVTLSNSVKTTVLAAVNVILWFSWLEIIILKDVFTSETNLLELVILALEDPRISDVITPTITVLSCQMSNSLVIPLSVLVIIVWCYFLGIITLNYVCKFGRNISKLVITTLSNPVISGALSLAVTAFFIMSNSLVITLSVIVSFIFSLHWFNFITLTHFFPSGLKNPYILRLLTVTITVFLTLSNTLIITLSVAVNVILWFNWLHIITLTDVFTLVSEIFMSFFSGSRDRNTCTELKRGAKRLAEVVKDKSTLLTSYINRTPVYKLPLVEKQMNIKGCKSFSFGEKSMNCNRNIMVVGAAGAGKSTVINAMINYILGVRWEDSFRFKLVDEARSKSQGHSQTSEINVYKLYHQEGFRVNYSLTIIDTPGFGDIGGIDRDKEITEQLRELFANQEGIGDIDAVGFVVQGLLTELTSTQRYVFDSALSIFGKDVVENIRILVTFADEQQQPVVKAIQVSGVPCPKDTDGLPVHFKFADNKSSVLGRLIWPNTEKTFELWNMGTKSMAGFFASLANIKTIRLTMSNEVLKERKHLEALVEELQKEVKIGLAKLEDIREMNEKLQEHEAEIRQNENFEFHVTVRNNKQVDISHTGKYITNCMQCYVTCHFPCGIPNDDGKKGCSAMGKNGYCRVCPGKCFWNVHSNQSFRWEYNELKETQTVKELKEKYEKALRQKVTLEELMKNLLSDYKSKQDDVVKLIAEAAKCLNRLKEIFLNPNPLTPPQYIDMLIKGEEQEAKQGWKDRVQSLMKIKDKAEIIAKVEKGEEMEHNKCQLNLCSVLKVVLICTMYFLSPSDFIYYFDLILAVFPLKP